LLKRGLRPLPTRVETLNSSRHAETQVRGVSHRPRICAVCPPTRGSRFSGRLPESPPWPLPGRPAAR
jgi:hypothetical protein